MTSMKHIRGVRSFSLGKEVRDGSSYTKPSIVLNQQKLVGYSSQQMFTVVSDVESYSQFVPYCKRSVVTLRGPNTLSANLMIGFKPFLNIKYTSHLNMIEPYLVTAVCKGLLLIEF